MNPLWLRPVLGTRIFGKKLKASKDPTHTALRFAVDHSYLNFKGQSGGVYPTFWYPEEVAHHPHKSVTMNFRGLQ